jgi:hypothetical protein
MNCRKCSESDKICKSLSKSKVIAVRRVQFFPYHGNVIRDFFNMSYAVLEAFCVCVYVDENFIRKQKLQNLCSEFHNFLLNVSGRHVFHVLTFGVGWWYGFGGCIVIFTTLTAMLDLIGLFFLLLPRPVFSVHS